MLNHQRPYTEAPIGSYDGQNASKHLRRGVDNHFSLEIQGTRQLSILDKTQGRNDEYHRLGSYKRGQYRLVIETGDKRCGHPQDTDHAHRHDDIEKEGGCRVILNQIGFAHQRAPEAAVDKGKGDGIEHSDHRQQAIVARTEQSGQDDTDHKAEAQVQCLVKRGPGNTFNGLFL